MHFANPLRSEVREQIYVVASSLIAIFYKLTCATRRPGPTYHVRVERRYIEET